MLSTKSLLQREMMTDRISRSPAESHQTGADAEWPVVILKKRNARAREDQDYTANLHLIITPFSQTAVPYFGTTMTRTNTV